VWGASLVLFPWRDWLMHHDYVLNYLVATVVDLLFMWVWLAALSRRLGASAFLLGCVAALTGAMMHEGLSVPMVAACCLVVLVRRFGIGWQCWVLLGLFLLGTAECALAPGIMSRAARDLGGDVQARALVVAKGCVLFFVLLACVCAGLAVGRWRKAVRRLARRPAFQMCVVNAFVGMVLCGAFADASVRFGWVTQIYSAIALGMIVRRSGIMHRRSAGSLAVVAGVLAAVVLVNTAAVERRFYIEDVQIRRGLSESAHGTLFHDLDRLSLVERLVTLSLPGGECWGGAFQQGGYNRLHPDRVYAVVPSSLESFDGRFDSVFGGDACIGRWRGMWLGRAVDSDAFDRRGCMAGQVSLRLTMADGEVRPIVADSWLFHTPDGRRWLYYHYYDWPEGVAAINFDIPD
ncbi:MAG: hypothetical protein K2O10_03690, partial [Muribaculaceae bacterium]|nr:hypothetical protein [Muribaculaceae bacterium]